MFGIDSLMQVRYFAAGKDRGVFVTLNKLTKLDAGENIVEEEAGDLSLCESTLSRLDSQVERMLRFDGQDAGAVQRRQQLRCRRPQRLRPPEFEGLSRFAITRIELQVLRLP